MSELGDLRRKFSRMFHMLQTRVYELGYEVALDFAKRCEKCPVGKVNSLHKLGLAIDIHLYMGGVYLDKTEDHLELGKYWESIGGSWGGRFSKADGNHYSLEYKGMR